METMLSAFKVCKAPNTVYYIPNFISELEENHILQKVYSVPKPKWTYLKNRKLQDYGGVPHKNGMFVEPMPDWLKIYTNKISELQVFEGNNANHVLINEYTPGQGIMPHSDGPLFYPTITTISCGSHTILEFFTDDEARQKICDIFLEPRSLVILKDDMYNKYLHSISEINSDKLTESCANLDLCDGLHLGDTLQRKTRISLTIRNVPKIAKYKLFDFFKK